MHVEDDAQAREKLAKPHRASARWIDVSRIETDGVDSPTLGDVDRALVVKALGNDRDVVMAKYLPRTQHTVERPVPMVITDYDIRRHTLLEQRFLHALCLVDLATSARAADQQSLDLARALECSSGGDPVREIQIRLPRPQVAGTSEYESNPIAREPLEIAGRGTVDTMRDRPSSP